MKNEDTWLVTGGAGFIGVNFVKMLLARQQGNVVVLDALTYAGNLASLKDEIDSGAIEFVRGDIGDDILVSALLDRVKPTYIVNFAAESHVDRSVDNPRPFVVTNVLGAQNMLECARRYVASGGNLKKYVQISTDEVYGDLDITHPDGVADERLGELLGGTVKLYGDESFSETTPLHPSSPYSASKAAADVMALAYYRTYGLPVVVTRCSNNYGPYQFPEKLIPLMINNMLEAKPLPVYGQGTNVRDWIYVDDHCSGVLAAALKGRAGEVYNFGGYSESTNIEMVKTLLQQVAKHTCRGGKYEGLAADNDAITEDLIRYVTDRPGHDRRYAIDAAKSMNELGWKPEVRDGIGRTVEWYLANRDWVKEIVDGQYSDYYEKMYGNR